MFEVEVYINFGCTAHGELKAFFMMGAHSSVIIFEFFFMTLSTIQGHYIHLQSSVSSLFCSSNKHV